MYNARAIDYAREHKFPMTAGSDVHTTSILGGGMAFKRKLASIEDFCKAVLGGEDYLLTDGDKWFNKMGEAI